MAFCSSQYVQACGVVLPPFTPRVTPGALALATKLQRSKLWKHFHLVVIKLPGVCTLARPRSWDVLGDSTPAYDYHQRNVQNVLTPPSLGYCTDCYCTDVARRRGYLH
jgi:hypothetical protein